MDASDKQAIQQAVARNLGALLSLPSAGMLRHQKSRFLCESEGGILIECSAAEAPLINELVTNQKPCGVAFRKDQVKMIFASPIRCFKQGYQINADTTVDAVLLEFPTEVKSIQRRSNYRVKVQADNSMSMRVWRIAERAYLGDQPMSAQEVKAELRDLSVGGVGVSFFTKDGSVPKVTPEDRLRVLITFAGNPVVGEGRMRPASDNQPAGRINTGIQFKNLENDLKGRQIQAQITRVVGELQRDEVRRSRLGLMSA